MQNSIDSLLQRVRDNINNDELFQVVDEVATELMKLENSYIAVEKIFYLLEEYPKVLFGMPGGLVHFAESFSDSGYEELLIESIKRKPTLHSLWMLNRVINDISGKDRDKYVTLLEEVVETADDIDIKNSAKEFFDFQLSEL